MRLGSSSIAVADHRLRACRGRSERGPYTAQRTRHAASATGTSAVRGTPGVQDSADPEQLLSAASARSHAGCGPRIPGRVRRRPTRWRSVRSPKKRWKYRPEDWPPGDGPDDDNERVDGQIDEQVSQNPARARSRLTARRRSSSSVDKPTTSSSSDISAPPATRSGSRIVTSLLPRTTVQTETMALLAAAKVLTPRRSVLAVSSEAPTACTSVATVPMALNDTGEAVRDQRLCRVRGTDS